MLGLIVMAFPRAEPCSALRHFYCTSLNGMIEQQVGPQPVGFRDRLEALSYCMDLVPGDCMRAFSCEESESTGNPLWFTGTTNRGLAQAVEPFTLEEGRTRCLLLRRIAIPHRSIAHDRRGKAIPRQSIALPHCGIAIPRHGMADDRRSIAILCHGMTIPGCGKAHDRRSIAIPQCKKSQLFKNGAFSRVKHGRAAKHFWKTVLRSLQWRPKGPG